MGGGHIDLDIPWLLLSRASLAMREDFPEPEGPYKSTGHF